MCNNKNNAKWAVFDFETQKPIKVFKCPKKTHNLLIRLFNKGKLCYLSTLKNN